MRVMTWNVFWRWGGDWRERAPAILATLRRAARRASYDLTVRTGDRAAS